jgi:hypothetical protein
MPVACHETGITALSFGSFNKPFNKVKTVIVVCAAIAFKAEMHISQNSRFLK